MITRIEALNFRCLRYVSRPLERFHVLVGPNASGKTTFFDVVGFVSRLLQDGLEAAIGAVTPDPLDLVYGRSGNRFELAIDAAIPLEETRTDFTRIRYELAVAISAGGHPEIHSERVLFVNEFEPKVIQQTLFPATRSRPNDLRRTNGTKAVLTKNPETGKDNFYPEVKKGSGGGWVPSFQLGKQRSAFANLPEDETRFPAATWFKRFLSAGVQILTLDSLNMRMPSPPRKGEGFKMDGSNLPWVIAQLEETPAFNDWIDHLATGLPDLVGVRTIERDEDRHRYLKVLYANGLEIPSWLTSDGTLRLLALTLPAFLKDFDGVLLIEEPENGIHPRAVETVFQALSGVDSAQIMLATHSPIILSIAEPSQVLCFAKDDSGATDIVRGDEHPALVDWQHDVSLGTLFATGVLG